MQIHWTYEGCSEQEIARIAAYWDRVQNELAGKIAELPDVPSELRIAVENGESDIPWEVQAALHVPGNTLVAEGKARTPEKVLDQVLHGLATAIDEVESVPASFTWRRDGLADMVNVLENYRSRETRSEAFLSFLAPLVASLGPYVHHELVIRERDGTLTADQLSVADVLDQVLIDAWDLFPARNKHRPLDLWLVQLADAVIGRAENQTGQESLENEISESPENNGSNWEEWAELATYPEEIELRELLPDEPGIDVWDGFDLETKQAHLSQMLSQLSRERRQAFVLNTAHGFNSAEIADFQDRPLQAVEEDIAAAATAIRRYVFDERSTDIEETFVRRELRDYGRRRG
jgi:DNA-directed RNA polymerase specialized sigma24 family protein